MYKLRKHRILRILTRIVSCYVVFTFIVTSVFLPTQSYAQSQLNLPAPGVMIQLSIPYNPAIVKGITIYPDNPLKFDFIIDPGDDNLQGEALKKEANKLIKYFMASLTVPEDEMWVNLSPYEKDRIIANGLSQTELGRDLLSQDYILKQLTASLMYPEEELGSDFWERVYAKAQEKYGTSEIPMNTFNKVWIVPEKTNVYVNGNNVFVVDNHLKVMLEEDYLALESNLGHNEHGVGEIPENQAKEINDVSSEVIREVIIPAIEKEVNEGKNFANLRQIFHSMILAAWYKQNLKESLLAQVYVNQNKVNGIDLEDKQIKEKIYNQYVEAFEKGVYDYIKEDYDAVTQQIIPRKYFSGGIKGNLKGKVKESKGRRSRVKLFSNLLTAMVFSVLLNNVTLAQETKPTNATVVEAGADQQDKVIELGHQRLNDDFLVQRFKQAVDTGGARVFTLYSKHESENDFYETVPAFQYVLEMAKKEGHKVAIFLERGHPDFDKLDVSLILEIGRLLRDNQPVDQELLDKLERQMENSARKFREDYKETLLIEDQREREKQLRERFSDPTSLGFSESNNSFMRNLLLEEGGDVEIYFERPSIEHALQQIRYVSGLLKEAGLALDTKEGVEFWREHALDVSPEEDSLRDQSEATELQNYLGDNQKVEVVVFRGLNHYQRLEGFLQTGNVEVTPYISAWHLREVAMLWLSMDSVAKQVTGLTRFTTDEVFSEEEVDNIISQEITTIKEVLGAVSSNEEYLETVGRGFVDTEEFTKDLLEESIKAVAREFLNSLVSVGLSKEEAVRAYVSSGGLRGIFFHNTMKVSGPFMGQTGLIEIIVGEQFRNSISKNFGTKEYYISKSIAGKLSQYVITNGVSATTEGESWNNLIDRIVDGAVEEDYIKESERDEYRKKVEEMSKRVISQIFSLFQSSNEEKNDLPEEPKKTQGINGKRGEIILEGNKEDVGDIDLNPNNLDLNVQGAVEQTIQESYGLRLKTHPYFKSYEHDPDGSEWYNSPNVLNYIFGPDLLPGFDPKNFVSNPNKSIEEIIASMQPLNSDHQRFSDLSAIEGAESKPLDINARNVNADLGLQRQIRKMIETGVIGKHTFVILSHGHFLAGMAELAKPNRDGEYIFDPSIYFPKGNWSTNSSDARNAIRQQFQLWAETIKRAREGNTKRQGIPAVVLFGHRDRLDFDTKTKGSANINPQALFGSPSEFADYLKENGFTKVVIITERFVENPNEFQDLGLESLRTGSFSMPNKDLYAYAKTLNDSLNVTVNVVSGDRRPPIVVAGVMAKDRELLEVIIREWGFVIPDNIPDKPITVEKPILKDLDSTLVTKHKDGVRYVFDVDKKKFSISWNGIPLDTKPERVSSEIRKFGEEILESDNVSEEIKKKVSEAMGAKKTGFLLPTINHGLDTTEAVLLAGEVQTFVQKDLGVNFTTADVQKGLGLSTSSQGLLIAILLGIPGVKRRKDGGWTQTPGGIDLNPNNLDLNVQGNEIKMNLSNPQILNNISVDGFIPVIINVAPITNIPLLIGELKEEADEINLSKVN